MIEIGTSGDRNTYGIEDKRNIVIKNTSTNQCIIVQFADLDLLVKAIAAALKEDPYRAVSLAIAIEELVRSV